MGSYPTIYTCFDKIEFPCWRSILKCMLPFQCTTFWPFKSLPRFIPKGTQQFSFCSEFSALRSLLIFYCPSLDVQSLNQIKHHYAQEHLQCWFVFLLFFFILAFLESQVSVNDFFSSNFLLEQLRSNWRKRESGRDVRKQNQVLHSCAMRNTSRSEPYALKWTLCFQG